MHSEITLLMLIHSVYFWLDRKLSPAQHQKFRKALSQLSKIEVVNKLYIGPPATTSRPAVDRTYDMGLTAILKNLDSHQSYQDHPIHKSFLQNYASFWTKVTIYDIQTT